MLVARGPRIARAGPPGKNRVSAKTTTTTTKTITTDWRIRRTTYCVIAVRRKLSGEGLRRVVPVLGHRDHSHTLIDTKFVANRRDLIGREWHPDDRKILLEVVVGGVQRVQPRSPRGQDQLVLGRVTVATRVTPGAAEEDLPLLGVRVRKSVGPPRAAPVDEVPVAPVAARRVTRN